MITDKGDYLEYYSPIKGEVWKEIKHQVDSVTFMRVRHADLLFWHTVNEGKKSIYSALLDDQAGLLKGVSDFVILIGIPGTHPNYPGCKYPFGAIELKRTNKSGKGKASPVSEAQKEYLKRVRDMGGFSAVAYGLEQFKLAVHDMLNSTNC